MPWGSKHGAWKGDAASEHAKHQRARRRFHLGPCERCGKPGRDRHHIDGDAGNNDRSNIAILCRSCHQKIDGRLDAAIERLKKINVPQPPKPCSNCGRLYKPLRRNRCAPCFRFWRKYGREIRPSEQRPRLI